MNGIWIEIHTSKRRYCARGGALIPWLPGEKVISITAVEEWQ